MKMMSCCQVTRERWELSSVLLAATVVLLFVPSLKGQTVAPSPFWRNQIEVPGDQYRVLGSSPGDPDWIKFTILVDDPETVYFQDSREYTFHYEFALEELGPFTGMTVQEFSRYSLFAAGQRAILGAVILPPSNAYPPIDTGEYGIQFIRLDPFAREEITELFDVVRDNIVMDPNVQVFYFPSYEQMEVARTNQQWFASKGMPVSSSARWSRGNICYAQGWALGRLRYVPGPEIASAYLEGRLSGRDILLTDGVPAEIPLVAGVLTLTPSTPNSHVAILSRSYGIPFAHLSQDADAERAKSLEGHEVVMRTFSVEQACDLRLIDLEDCLDQATIEEILALKSPVELDVQPMDMYGSAAVSTEGLVSSDIAFFGGKAANFGFLRRAIPDHSPRAIAFSFDVWSAFLDQPYLATGHTLCEALDMRLSPYRAYPPHDMTALANELKEIRDSLFKSDHITHFAPAHRTEILQVLADPEYGFAADRKLRFRSSTNVEDSEQFTGAGLYDSYSGCLIDDLDYDDEGPCGCDPTRKDERGVLRAIRKVFASFYNDRAYLARVRHGVDESTVGMALLVHHSFPDEIELANGVGTLTTDDSSGWNIDLVTQAGAVSVTNPTDGSVPEEVHVSVSAEGIYPRFKRGSNILPLGNRVMTWQGDYIQLSELIVRVAEQFEKETGKTDFVLDFEYKRLAPEGKLIIKQVREIPKLDTTQRVVPFLAQDAVYASEYKVYQGEYGDVFANHRLKSKWRFRTRNQWLEPGSVEESICQDVYFEYSEQGRIESLSGDPNQWPEYGFSYFDNTTTDSWALGEGLNRRLCRLATHDVGKLVAPSESAILTLNDLGKQYNFGSGFLEFSVTHARPVLSWGLGEDASSFKSTESVLLCPVLPSEGRQVHQTRTFTDTQGTSVAVTFYWPRLTAEPTAGSTWPLAKWDKTVIQGLTAQPIVLSGYYSQTYRAGHQNLLEQFLFEPSLEPAIAPQILDQLREKNIRLIYFVNHSNQSRSQIVTVGFDEY